MVLLCHCLIPSWEGLGSTGTSGIPAGYRSFELFPNGTGVCQDFGVTSLSSRVRPQGSSWDLASGAPHPPNHQQIPKTLISHPIPSGILGVFTARPQKPRQGLELCQIWGEQLLTLRAPPAALGLLLHIQSLSLGSGEFLLPQESSGPAFPAFFLGSISIPSGAILRAELCPRSLPAALPCKIRPQGLLCFLQSSPKSPSAHPEEGKFSISPFFGCSVPGLGISVGFCLNCGE